MENQLRTGCSTTINEQVIDPLTHWNKAYENGVEHKLGWYETDVSATLKLINKTLLPTNAHIINIGAGSTTLIDELITRKYNNLIATDISKVALENLKNRLGKEHSKVQFITDDLINPTTLNSINPVDLWVDRAVLHFFTEEVDQSNYFDLLNKTLKKGGFAIFAEFNLEGAKKCSGLPVHRYNEEILQDKLGRGFRLLNSFDYLYAMPSGDTRPYIYTLFRKE